MKKLLLLQIIIMAIFIPVQMSKDPSPQRGFKRTLAFYFAFCLCFVAAASFLFFRLP